MADGQALRSENLLLSLVLCCQIIYKHHENIQQTETRWSCLSSLQWSSPWTGFKLVLTGEAIERFTSDRSQTSVSLFPRIVGL